MVKAFRTGYLFFALQVFGTARARILTPPAIRKPALPANYQAVDVKGATLPPIDTVYYFDQLLDHDDPSQGTFQQRYWTTWEFYEPGGPIIMFTPGEVVGDGYEAFLTNSTLNGQIAQQEHGATIVIEHRLFGGSNPYENLTTPNLKYLTLDQATSDFAYFAQNVQLPMPNGSSVSAPNEAPWIMVGGSYSGTLVSYTMSRFPGVFWAGYASSAPVQAMDNFWSIYEPIRLNMPQNCSADVEAVISYLDGIFTNGTDAQKQAAKDNFGVGTLPEDLDFLGALRHNLEDWQSLQPTSGGGIFYDWCDALEVWNGTSAPASGWGLEHAYQAWGEFWNNTYYGYMCDIVAPQDCIDTYNPDAVAYTLLDDDDSSRSWTWLVCNELGWYQEGPPADVSVPAVVSRLLNATYEERECNLYFPGYYNSTYPAPNISRTNSVYKGWEVELDRVFFANGKNDPWLYATVSSPFANRTSTASMPIAVSDGFHESDLQTADGLADPTILAVQQEALGYFARWMKEWKPSSS